MGGLGNGFRSGARGNRTPEYLTLQHTINNLRKNSVLASREFRMTVNVNLAQKLEPLPLTLDAAFPGVVRQLCIFYRLSILQVLGCPFSVVIIKSLSLCLVGGKPEQRASSMIFCNDWFQG